MELDQWIKAARTHAKLTQPQLGERLNVTKSNVSAWENGLHEPSYAQMLAIQAATGYPLPHAPWPLPLVDQERFMRLSPEGRGYVQKAMIDAITECERPVSKNVGVTSDGVRYFNMPPAPAAQPSEAPKPNQKDPVRP